MKMRDQIVIAATPARIYALAAATERWPQILPHYRFVRVLDGGADLRTVEMAARRGVVPVRWRAQQRNDSLKPEIHFRHVGGWTDGMDVYWRFEPADGGTRVIIDHELRSPLAPVIARFFIHPIAQRTLACVKAEAEREA
jgi:ribosome-associated toxin RatA of RatAB toxin-antitoxin module